MPEPTLSTAISRLTLPEGKTYAGGSIRYNERELEAAIPLSGELLDATCANTIRFPPPEYALNAFTRAAEGEGDSYTPYVGDAGVRKVVTSNIATRFDLDIGEGTSTILTPGTQGALYIAIAALVGPGDKVILPDPEYLSTERTLRFFGAEVIRVPVRFENIGDRPTLDLDALARAAAQKPKLFIFSHPNNPTGAIYSDETVRQIAALAREYDFYVLADELYARLVYDNETFKHIANLPMMRDRTITTLGPSKTEALSGYRLGVAIAPQPLIDVMEDMQSITSLRAPAYSQHVLKHWLSDDAAFVAKRIAEYQAIRDWTVDYLNESGLFATELPWGTSYIFPRVLVEASDQALALAIKKQAGIVVNPGYQFGSRGVGHLRLCIAQDESEWSEALKKLVEVAAMFRRL